MPQVVSKSKPVSSRHYIVWLGTGVLLIVIIAGGLWYYNRESQKNAYAKAVQQATTADRHGYYGTEIQLYKAYLAKNPPTKYKDVILPVLANALINDHQFDEAITLYKQLDGHPGTTHKGVIQGLASAYESKGDKATAIKEYQALIVILRAENGPTSAMDVSGYQNQIRHLGGTP